MTLVTILNNFILLSIHTHNCHDCMSGLVAVMCWRLLNADIFFPQLHFAMGNDFRVYFLQHIEMSFFVFELTFRGHVEEFWGEQC